jgi:hypothetical protein
MLGLAHCDFIKLMIQRYPSSAIAAEADVASFSDPALARVPVWALNCGFTELRLQEKERG